MKLFPWILAIVCATSTLVARGPQTGGPGLAGAAQAPAQTNTAFILGQVVDVVTERPIPEATVTVTMRGGGAGGGQAGVVDRAGGAAGRGGLVAGRGAGPGAPNTVRLLTDADGRFVVHDLPKGVVNVTAIASGYVQSNVGQARPTGPARPIDLDEGERLTNVKIRLWKHAVVTGTVVDEHGEPAVGATVRMLRQAMVNGKPKYSPGAQAKTDDRGVYRISAITPGTFLMVVPQTLATLPTSTLDAIMSLASSASQSNGMADLMSAGASAPNVGGAGLRVGDAMVSAVSGGMPPPIGDRLFVYQTLFYPTATTSAQGGVLTLGSGEERSGVDFQLRVLPAVRVSGTVMGPAGPVPGAPVRLVPAGVIDFTSDNGVEAATTMSAPDGTFQLLGVPSGQYVLSILKPASPPLPAGMASNPLMQFATSGMSAAGQPVALYAQTALSIGGDDVAGVSLTLTEGAKVSGRVEFVGTAPIPQAGQLRAVSVVLTSADGRTASSPQLPSATDHVGEDAQFKTLGYPPGKYLVSLSPPPAPNTWLLKSVTLAGRDVLEEGIDLKDTDVGDVVITYTDRIGSLTGNVRTPAGAPSGTATVVAFPADYQAWVATGMSVQRSRTAVATKKGVFTMVGLPPGDYLLAALDDADLGDPRDGSFFDAIARVSTRITLADGEKKSQDLQTVKGAK